MQIIQKINNQYYTNTYISNIFNIEAKDFLSNTITIKNTTVESSLVNSQDLNVQIQFEPQPILQIIE